MTSEDNGNDETREEPAEDSAATEAPAAAAAEAPIADEGSDDEGSDDEGSDDEGSDDEGSEDGIEREPALYLAEFETPSALIHAAEKVRDAGYSKWDCHSPYAIHGMDEAMGLRPTKIGIIAFVCGLSGVAIAFGMMYFMNATEATIGGLTGYPLIVGGKPEGAFPSMVPILFELGILLCGLSTLLGLLALAKLPRHHHPIFYSERFTRATDDRFFISIEVGDEHFDLDRTRNLLESTHPSHLELIEEEAA